MPLEKLLTKILRHDSYMEVKLDLPFDHRGFIGLETLRTMVAFQQLTPERLKKIERNDAKKRFTVEERDGEIFVRANNGHTFGGVLPDLRVVHVPWAVHGTTMEAWYAIRTQGLRRMARDYIHMAAHTDTRQYKTYIEVDVHINTQKMNLHGIDIMRCTNGVLYTFGVDGVLCPCFFHEAKDARTGQTLAFSCVGH